MNKKALTVGVLAFTILIGAGVVFTASAYRGNNNRLETRRNFECNDFQEKKYGQGNGGRNWQGRGMINGSQRGQNRGGNFIDRNGNGICDHME